MENKVKHVLPMPTHLVSFWGARCYMNDETGDVWGINWFHERLLSAALWFDNLMSAITLFFDPEWEREGFRFKVMREDGDRG